MALQTTLAVRPIDHGADGLKHLDYANGVDMDMTYNDRLQPATYDLVKNTTDIMKKNYEYAGDGSLKFVEDDMNGIFDRLNLYDHAGRVKLGKSSTEASGTTVTSNQDTQLPYRQTFTHNAFNNMTARDNLHWGVDYWNGVSNNLSYTYANNRITNSYWQYDADGRVTQSSLPDEPATSTYDGRGLLSYHLIQHHHGDQTEINRYYSGDGREGKRTKRKYTNDPEATSPPYGTWADEPTVYYIRSSVFGGQVISETHPTGAKKKTFVLAAGARIATQSEYTYSSTTAESVSFEHFDASGMSFRTSSSTGTVISGDGSFDGQPGEMDPMGGNAGLPTPYITNTTAPRSD